PKRPPLRTPSRGAACRSVTGVAAQWVLRWHFDDADAEAVRVYDPHLVEPPRLSLGRAHDGCPPVEQGAVGGGQVAHLDPQPHLLVLLVLLGVGRLAPRRGPLLGG